MSDWLAEEKPVNWVKRRAECTHETVLRAIKYQLQLDIKEFQKEKVRPDFTFNLNCTTRSINITVCSCPYFEREACLLIGKENEITVQVPDIELFTIQYKWNEAEAVCEFFIDGKPCKRWQISQKVLAPLLFR